MSAADQSGAAAEEVTPTPAVREAHGAGPFSGIVDFVERTTKFIWNHHNPGLIARYYTPTTIVHTPDGDICGRDAVIEGCVKKMAAFPDIKDHISDTIWVQDGPDRWRTSMRWTWTARGTGYGTHGPPTGRRVVCTGIANCVVHGERYIEEWVVYDDVTLLRQLGISLAAHLAACAPLAADDVFAATGEVHQLLGGDFPAPMVAAVGGVDSPHEAVHRFNHEVWNRKMVGDVDVHMHPAVVAHVESGRELYGTGDVKHHVLATMAMLPNCRRFVDEVYLTPGDDGEQRVATRWTILGTNTGPSRYGPPTGRSVRIMGITHQRVVDGLVVEEWQEWSELALMKALLLPIAE